ncbi:leucine-rich repeat domain-containing protein [Methanolapillus millepedarum]|uniref:Leucine-rich repeat domain-containing protein n=1 Tax=Methanolapillus millepedarum TaxID=3028296 RepID=A0AA96V384_9EURY|nr:hypothetical protein MsAc7_12360 [Methanosarcinaceae archaeon Ac7]
MRGQNNKIKSPTSIQNGRKKIHVSVLLASVLLLLLLAVSPAMGANVSVDTSDLNSGTVPTYNAGDTLILTGADSLEGPGWITLEGLTNPYHLVLNDATVTISTFRNNSNILSITGNETDFIDDNCFSNCSNLTSINLPNATTLGTWSFSKCSNLTSIDFPNITTIGNWSFSFCPNLISINFPNAITVEKDAFVNCSNLTSISLPNATTFEDDAFANCSNLTSISLPKAETFGNRAFQNCSNLTSISLPSATTLEDGAFSYCSNLFVVDFGDEKPTFINTDGFIFYNINHGLCVLTNESVYDDLDDFPDGSFQRKGSFMSGKISINVGDTLTLNSSFTPETDDVLTWTFNGTQQSATEDVYSKQDVQKTDAGVYKRFATINDQDYMIAFYEVTVLDNADNETNGTGGTGNATVVDTNQTETNTDNSSTNTNTSTNNNSSTNNSNNTPEPGDNKNGMLIYIILILLILILTGLVIYVWKQKNKNKNE